MVGKTMKRASKVALVTSAVVVMFSLGLYFVGPTVSALGKFYFDDVGGDFKSCDVTNKQGTDTICGSAEINLVVGETRYVQRTGTVLRAYFRENHGKIRIENVDWCPGNAYGDSIETEDNPGQIGTGDPVTRINIRGSAASDDVFGRRYSASSDNCKGSNPNVSIVVTDYLRNGNGIGLPGLWYADISLDHRDQASGACDGGNYGGCDGTQNAMTVELASPDADNDVLIAPIGHEESGGFFQRVGTGVTVDADTGPDNYGLRVKFGTNCNVTGPGDYDLKFFDLDGSPSDGGAQDNGPVQLNLKRISPSGKVQWLHDGGPQDWHDDRPALNSNEIKKAPGQSNALWSWGFRAHPDYDYELQVLNVFKNNTLQASTPFDGGNAYFDCDHPQVRIRPENSWTQVGSQLQPGETGVFVAQLDNLSSDKTGHVDKLRAHIWLDDGDRQYTPANPNDKVFQSGGNNYFEYINSDVSVPPKGLKFTTNPPFAANANYAFLCGQIFRVDAVPTPPAPIETIITGLPTAVCIPIGKYPGLVARAGDVRSGGAVPSANTTCKLNQIPSLSAVGDGSTVSKTLFEIQGHRYKDNAGIRNKGSYAGLGVLTPGLISEFGSLNDFYKGNGDMNSWGFFGTGAWKSSYHNVDGHYLGENLVGNAATHCLPDVDSLYPLLSPNTDIDATDVTRGNLSSTSASRRYTFKNSGRTLTINGGSLSPGQRVVIRVTQDNGMTGNSIVLNGSVNYASGPFGSISELPQLVIVADKPIDIKIKDLAQNFSGVVLATAGNLYTCEGYNGKPAVHKLTTADCQDKPLAFNGATIVGGRLYPFRTAGFNTQGETGTFAEMFNLSPETLLSDYARAQQLNKLRVDYQTGLPPRF